MNRIPFSLFFTLIFLVIGHSVFAQSDQNHYQKVTYYHVDRESLDTFFDKVNEWKETHNTQITNSDRVAWRLYRVPFSSNASAWYNFVTIEISESLNSLQSPDRSTTSTLRDNKNQRMKLLYAVHSEIWETEAEVYTTVDSPSRYLNANYMFALPHRMNEYLELETDIAQPLHQHQADNNRMDGWNLNRLIFPTGTTVDYNFITTDFYSSLEQIEMGITREVIMSVHPEMDVDEFEDYADSIRERVWSDLWELIEYTN